MSRYNARHECHTSTSYRLASALLRSGFTNTLSGEDVEGYQAMAARMNELAQQMDGFLGLEAAATPADLRITVSYWRDLDAIKKWREHAEHRLAQQKGKSTWYRHYQLRVCRVEREYGR